MSEAATTEGAPAGSEGTQDTGLDLGPVMGRFDELGSRTERMEQQLSEFLTAQQPEEEGDDEFDLSSLFTSDDEPEPEQQRGQLDPQALQALMDQRLQSALEERLGPVAQQVQGMQVQLDAEALTARYPELADQAIAKPVVDAARSLAVEMGNPDLAHNMKFVEAIYKAQKADRLAAGEVPVGGTQGFELERAGGAGPTAGDEPNIAERIIANRKAAAWPPRF